MKTLPHILPLCLLLLGNAAVAQKKEDVAPKEEKAAPTKSKKFSNTGRQSAYAYLNEAKALREKSPAEAIRLVEQSLNYARKDGDVRTEADAYILLGSIYEDIDQKELALQRYQQALNALNRSKEGGETASIYQRMGRLQVALKSDKEAEFSFRRCIETTYDNALKQRCEEGLADVELLRGNAQGSISKLDYVESNFKQDSVSTARLEARRSNVYIQQNDFPKASESYLNSIRTLPKDADLSKEDLDILAQSQMQLLAFDASNVAGKVEIAKKSPVGVLPAEASNDQVIAENLKVAAVYAEQKQWSEAEKFIVRSKNLVNAETDAALAAELYRKSAEINRRKGNMTAALADFQAYFERKEKAIEDLRDELNQQVQIVKEQGQVDVSQKDYDIEERERALLETQVSRQRIVIALLMLLLLASLVFFYFLKKNIDARRKAHQKLMLKSLRTQMNPHFIFNALNSVNNFIAKNDELAANKFLSEFSLLMRKVLDYSQQDFISFEEEMELNERYLRLEHFRFRDKFDYVFENEAARTDLEVPPMLIQPFIENAVWHGLRYKETTGRLEVRVKEDDRNLIVTVQDDGIGREKSKALKTENQRKYKSAGLENVSKRVALINKLYGKNYEISVSDADSGAADTGTVVRITIPKNSADA
jgi:tetratricopeptide (TPR) repeat protein